MNCSIIHLKFTKMMQILYPLPIYGCIQQIPSFTPDSSFSCSGGRCALHSVRDVQWIGECKIQTKVE